MKQLIISVTTLIVKASLCSTALLAVFISPGCKKESAMKPQNLETALKKEKEGITGEVLKWYTGLNPETEWELQQARAATAKYRFDTVKAYQDGYRNISVDVENMGHHFLKAEYVDGTFDIRHPELLVYNGTHEGNMELVAVEYAVPINQPEPPGFTGTNDVWDHNTTFQLWLLHAWVWRFNPSGVFNPLNPDVHLH